MAHLPHKGGTSSWRAVTYIPQIGSRSRQELETICLGTCHARSFDDVINLPRVHAIDRSAKSKAYYRAKINYKSYGYVSFSFFSFSFSFFLFVVQADFCYRSQFELVANCFSCGKMFKTRASIGIVLFNVKFENFRLLFFFNGFFKLDYNWYYLLFIFRILSLKDLLKLWIQ